MAWICACRKSLRDMLGPLQVDVHRAAARTNGGNVFGMLVVLDPCSSKSEISWVHTVAGEDDLVQWPGPFIPMYGKNSKGNVFFEDEEDLHAQMEGALDRATCCQPTNEESSSSSPAATETVGPSSMPTDTSTAETYESTGNTNLALPACGPEVDRLAVSIVSAAIEARSGKCSLRSVQCQLARRGISGACVTWMAHHFRIEGALVCEQHLSRPSTLAEFLSLGQQDPRVHGKLLELMSCQLQPAQLQDQMCDFIAGLGLVSRPSETQMLQYSAPSVRVRSSAPRFAVRIERSKRKQEEIERTAKKNAEELFRKAMCTDNWRTRQKTSKATSSEGVWEIVPDQLRTPEKQQVAPDQTRTPEKQQVAPNQTRSPGKQHTVCIHKKMQVLQYWKGLGDDIKQREAACMQRFPESLTGKGMLGRWHSACQKQGWKFLPDAIQRKWKETPNWLRNAIGCSDLKGPGPELRMPEEIAKCFDQIMTSRIHGLGPNRRVNEVLRSRNFWQAMVNLTARYNARVEVSNHQAREHLQEEYDRWQRGDIDRGEFMGAFKQLKRKVPTI